MNLTLPLALLFATLAALDMAHTVSPILLAWSHPGLRAIAKREWRIFVLAPAAVLVGVLAAPAETVAGLYWAWLSYHYGMQNFGLLQLHKQGGTVDRRVLEGLLCLGIAAVGFGCLSACFPLTSLPGLLIVLVWSVDHWLCDIALSSRASGRLGGFIGAVLAIGVTWLLLRNGPLSERVVPQIVVLRSGLGMIHFVYSARVWRLSDPRVRAAIGSEIF